MSSVYEFTKLSAVEALAEVPENANALIEVDGTIKRVPGSGLGGAKGIKTAIIKSSDYDEMLNFLITGNSEPAPAIAEGPAISYECINMAFEEAYQTMESGEPLNAVMMCVTDGGCWPTPYDIIFTGVLAFGVPAMVAVPVANNEMLPELFWTADGLSTETPSQPK